MGRKVPKSPGQLECPTLPKKGPARGRESSRPPVSAATQCLAKTQGPAFEGRGHRGPAWAFPLRSSAGRPLPGAPLNLASKPPDRHFEQSGRETKRSQFARINAAKSLSVSWLLVKVAGAVYTSARRRRRKRVYHLGDLDCSRLKFNPSTCEPYGQKMEKSVQASPCASEMLTAGSLLDAFACFKWGPPLNRKRPYSLFTSLESAANPDAFFPGGGGRPRVKFLWASGRVGYRDPSSSSRRSRTEFSGPSRARPAPQLSDPQVTPWVAGAPQSSKPVSPAGWPRTARRHFLLPAEPFSKLPLLLTHAPVLYAKAVSSSSEERSEALSEERALPPPPPLPRPRPLPASESPRPPRAEFWRPEFAPTLGSPGAAGQGFAVEDAPHGSLEPGCSEMPLNQFFLWIFLPLTLSLCPSPPRVGESGLRCSAKVACKAAWIH
nr:uncharacterized protein LOC105475926 [Macaca nemestrina]